MQSATPVPTSLTATTAYKHQHTLSAVHFILQCQSSSLSVTSATSPTLQFTTWVTFFLCQSLHSTIPVLSLCKPLHSECKPSLASHSATASCNASPVSQSATTFCNWRIMSLSASTSCNCSPSLSQLPQPVSPSSYLNQPLQWTIWVSEPPQPATPLSFSVSYQTHPVNLVSPLCQPLHSIATVSSLCLPLRPAMTITSLCQPLQSALPTTFSISGSHQVSNCKTSGASSCQQSAPPITLFFSHSWQPVDFKFYAWYNYTQSKIPWNDHGFVSYLRGNVMLPMSPTGEQNQNLYCTLPHHKLLNTNQGSDKNTAFIITNDICHT